MKEYGRPAWISLASLSMDSASRLTLSLAAHLSRLTFGVVVEEEWLDLEGEFNLEGRGIGFITDELAAL